MSTVVADKLKEVSRFERKRYNAGAESLQSFIHHFFKECHGKTKGYIEQQYQIRDTDWRRYAARLNRKLKANFFDPASFETAITGSDKSIRKSKVSAQAKLQMIRTVRLLNKKSQFIGFFKDIPLWWKFIFNERKALHRK